MNKSVVVGLGLVVLGSGIAYAQFARGGGADYATAGMDPQRTSWAKVDRFISKDAFAKGGFQLQWKLKAESSRPNSVVGGTTSGGGLTKPLNVIITSNNTLTTLDDDTGIQGWVDKFNAGAAASPTPACPGGMSANASRPVVLAPAPAAPGRAGAGGGAGGAAGAAGAALAGGRAPVGYTSVVGDPGAGLPADVVTRGGGRAPTAATPAAGAAGAPGVAIAGAPGAGAPPAAAAAPGAAAAGGAGGGFGRGAGAPTYKSPFSNGRFGSGGGFFAATSDGVLHTIGDGSGKELQAPVQFLPANARVSDLTAVPEINDQYHSYVIYAATTNGCGGVPNRVWAINLATDDHPITHLDTGASVVGDLAFSSTGTVYVAVGKGAAGSAYSNAILALEPKTLTVKDWFTDPKANFTSTPTIFKQGNKEILAAATADGRVYVLDTASLGGSDHKTPLSVSAAVSKGEYAPKALAAWVDADGSTYIAEPFAGPGPSGAASNGTVTSGGVVALKLSDSDSLSPAWVSGDIASPLPPIVVNGVLFSASKSPAAVLYALDASSGKQFWSSGKTIASPAGVAPLWVGAGQVYLAASDNTVYAFGFSEERYPTPGQ